MAGGLLNVTIAVLFSASWSSRCFISACLATPSRRISIGISFGIGAAIARELAGRGADLVVSARRRAALYQLAGELAAYLLEHARRERFALLSQPVIEFETDDRLRLGEFGIQTRVVPPYTFVPRRCAFELRPFRVLPAPFL